MKVTGFKAAVLFSLAATPLLCTHSGWTMETPQQRVHRMSPHVMPFDMAETVHVFKMTTSGGVMKVLARDPAATDQVRLIQQHLSHEAQRFQQGDYGDPARLHGADMPGLAELRANPSAVDVSYTQLPDGARLAFETQDPDMLTAIHRWFGAQLSEHAADARAE